MDVITTCTVDPNHITMCTVGPNHITTCTVGPNHTTTCTSGPNHRLTCTGYPFKIAQRGVIQRSYANSHKTSSKVKTDKAVTKLHVCGFLNVTMFCSKFWEILLSSLYFVCLNIIDCQLVVIAIYITAQYSIKQYKKSPAK